MNECPGCGKQIKPTPSGRWRRHKSRGEVCDFSGTVIQETKECVKSMNASSAGSTPDDATDPAKPATPSTRSSQPGQDKAAGASTSANVDGALPGVTSYISTLNDLAQAQLAAHKAKVEATLSPFSQPAPHHDDIEQPPLFSQPAGRKSEAPAREMTDLGKELTARLKELFYSYDNRRSADNRSAQTTMGPSEIGTPCDRRLALSLMRMPPINPGGDGWAAFVGTCIHAGLEKMFLWADGGTGRFAVEQRLEFESKYVPKGTADLIDRTLFMVDDHKCQGRWSRNKLKSSGPSRTYRVQAHVYAHGARRRGERIDYVAIISWPRDEATLDDLYVWTEEYRPDIVKDAFERVHRIGDEVEDLVDSEVVDKALKAAEYDVADDCRFCKFYLPDARSITDGCNGRR